jgi:hypothetical protein
LAPAAVALERRLALRRRAREDGERNQPPHDAEHLSAAERAVLDAVVGERARIEQERSELGAECERRLRALTPAPQDFSGAALEARLALKQAAGRLAHDWAEAEARAGEAKAELDAFKRANLLRRPAIYPRSTLLQSGLLFSAALFEALFSAALFAEDDERGLLGGAIIAIGLAGANVAVGFLAGFLGLRYLQHAHLPVKAVGALVFVGLSALAAMFNLFAADWRDQMAGPGVTLGAEAGLSLWSLLQLESPQSIILLMLGAGVWAFATLKGYSGFDDPYPEYGKMDRAEREAADALSDFRADAREDLETPVNAAKATIGARLEIMRAEFDTMNKAFDAAAIKLEALDAQARTLDEAVAAAIVLYRQENLARRTEAPPAYFSAPPPAAPLADPLSDAARMIDDARARLGDAQAAAAQALEALLAELDQTTARLSSGASP